MERGADVCMPCLKERRPSSETTTVLDDLPNSSVADLYDILHTADDFIHLPTSGRGSREAVIIDLTEDDETAHDVQQSGGR